jgi:hypothetical protein
VIAGAAAIPISNARRAVLALATLFDTEIFEALPSSHLKQLALLVAFVVGVLATTGIPPLRRFPRTA